jgi:hypothetical protein
VSPTARLTLVKSANYASTPRKVLNWQPQCPDRPGDDAGQSRRLNHFDKSGSIYWSPNTAAHELYGVIRQQWAVLGWERSYFGYPTTGKFDIASGRRPNFLHGYIERNSSTGVTIDRQY